MTQKINVRAEIESAPIGKFHWFFGVLLGIVMFFDGYDLFNAAYVIPLVRTTWQPSSSMIGIMLSSGIAGLTIGSVLQGLLADRIGRRRVMLIALWVLTASNALLAFAVDSPVSFTVCRLILGMSLGMITPLVITYINELAPKKVANIYTTLVFIVGFSLGGIFAGVIGIALGQRYGWEWIYVVGVLCLIVSMAAQAWFPESIRYLALRGDTERVRQLLSRLRPERSGLYAAAEFEMPKPSSQAASVSVLLSPVYRRRTVISWVAGFLGLFCVHGLTGWLPTLVIQKGAGISSGFAYGALVMVAALFGALACAWLADRINSRAISMAVGYVFAGVAMICLGMYSSQWVIIGLVAATGFFLFGAQAVLNNFQAMSYQTEVRGTGVGVAIALNRVGGILGPFLIGVLHSIHPAPKYTFFALAVALFLAAVTVSFGRRNMVSADSAPDSLAQLQH